MVPYRPVSYRRRSLAPILGQTFDEILGIHPAAGDAIRFVGHAVGAWFGIYIGTRPGMSPLVRAIGWIVGAGMATTGALDIVSLLKRAAGTHPEPSR